MKVKFADFQITSSQRATDRVEPQVLRELLAEAWERGQGKSVRLIGAGVRFRSLEKDDDGQMEMF